MLSFLFTDADGHEIILSSPLSLVMRMEEDVPADDLTAVFPYLNCGELAQVSVFDGSRLVFKGVVDEEEHLMSSKGEYLRISARSLAAHLLDNEAEPQSYDHPSARLIYERCASGFGLGAGDVDGSTYFGELTVTKGMSCWTAVQNFCKACYSSSPRISADGRLFMRGLVTEGTVMFGDGAGGIPFVSLGEKKKRCEEISRVRIKTADSSGYRSAVENPDAVKRGVRRERYINAALTSTPIKCADTMIANGSKRAYSLSLRCPGWLGDILGRAASVSSNTLGSLNGLYVSSIKYHLDSKSDYTDIELKRRYS